MATRDEAQHRRRILADSVYLEGRSQALIQHLQALVAPSQRLRARYARLLRRIGALRRQACKSPLDNEGASPGPGVSISH